MTAVETNAAGSHADRMDRMYRTQRHFYDLTRKYYLFGRDTLIRELDVPAGASLLEVGCGTGRNLALIGRRFPQARLFGLDISAEMLVSAEAKLSRPGQTSTVLRVADATDFQPSEFGETGFDRIVISYALSMIPEWEKAIEAAIAALNPGGSLHIADFGQQERLPGLFRRGLQAWLKRFHVTPRKALVAALKGKAAKSGDIVDFQPIGRGYAWLFTYRRLAR
ncbi:class I SAM-dependent methyltransferase [Rhizobium herbae]|uniref:S-adenosylmethionine-diacylgycerolhomoserine-N-methyltransferase n=1 Tax=Rhizobium herbae TaxID=508661 RepID=A0ABS4EHN6_9HYPH|nr:class I SAM-dependent methyltransferase [Rhizobium herbae]MBP1857457.1 S-adenosylmethionine-diacylgycerolhomoserine-N-methyltransferase [Rhizobium herbae]